MWLLNARTYELEYFIGEDIPNYSILSHRWGSTRDEVTFQELRRDQDAQKDDWETREIHSGERLETFRYEPSRKITCKKGWRKIELCCAQALQETTINQQPVEYAWVDTCCIDKNSSAELSEAINSMFKWYKCAHLCYAFLDDVPIARSFETSDWWSRGWTLQELIAPKDVVFYDHSWRKIATRSHDYLGIARITGITYGALLGVSLEGYSIAHKMSWAAARRTSRIEDRAYSLLGIFNVNMPLLYGEGSKAFRRLQVELFRSNHDLTIFAWKSGDTPNDLRLINMAPDPDSFSWREELDPYPVRTSDLAHILGIQINTVSTLDRHGYVDIQQVSCDEGFTVSNLCVSMKMVLLQYSPQEFFVPISYDRRILPNKLIGFLAYWNNETELFQRTVFIDYQSDDGKGDVPFCWKLAWMPLPICLVIGAKFVVKRISLANQAKMRSWPRTTAEGPTLFNGHIRLI